MKYKRIYPYILESTHKKVVDIIDTPYSEWLRNKEEEFVENYLKEKGL